MFSLAVLPSLASADVILPGSHYVEECVKVVNLDRFPDIVLTGYYTGPMVKDYETYTIKNNECWTKGYKLNSFKVYYNQKEKAGQIGTDNFFDIPENISGGSVADSDHTSKKTVEYSLATSSDNKVILYKSKVISEYNDGSPSKTEVFPGPEITPTPTNTCLDLKRGLIYGSRDLTDKAVTDLQDYLRTNGYLDSRSTGYYGLLTFKAVKVFQTKNSIKATGTVGPVTRAKIRSLTCN